MNASALPRAKSWRTLNLAPGGRSLIEASAGTGKTWTIAALYLRLLLEGEKSLTPKQIVVTTFTDAAAQELRERLRARLLGAEALALAQVREPARDAPALAREGDAELSSAQDTDDFADWLHTRWHNGDGDVATDLLRLRLALAELDLAPIGTLHGLCRRILADFPFDSGSGFRAPALIDGEDLLDELVEDLWRCVQQDDDAAFTGKLATLRQTLQQALAPGVELWAPDAAAFARALPAEKINALDALLREPNLFARSNAKLKTALQALTDFVRDPAQSLSDKDLENLLDPDIDKQFKPQRLAEMRDHPLLRDVRAAVRLLGYARERDRIEALQRWSKRVRQWRDERLAARDQHTFDSLIERVATALAAPDRTLADALCKAWPAALVDEFQDTDALQYQILNRIYRAADDTKRGRLVLIGDPKQAIYGFRGGDVDAYLAAAHDADEVLHLDINRRSTRAYVKALNELYADDRATLSSRTEHAIRYEQVESDGRRDQSPYLEASGAPPSRPLQFHYMPEAPNSAAQRRELALTACANQIAALLNAGERVGERDVQPGDIAVLLPTHRDVTRLRELLLARAVPCVTGAPSSVFEGDSARELHLMLFALAHPGDHGALRAALATSLGGWTFAELAALDDGSERWNATLHHVEALRQQWRREGVLAAVLTLAREAAQRRATLAERERLLTDLRHLGELLQAQAQQLEGEAQLLAWFAQQRRGEGDEMDAVEERRLRLESDAKRVRLSTLHASKGLEFPIVFLPLMWAHIARPRRTQPVLREPLCGDARVLGFGPLPARDAKWDEQDERHRVLYVALTRAQYACHVYALDPQRGARAGSAKPALDPERSALDALLARLLAAVPDGKSVADIAAHVGWSEGLPWPLARHTPARTQTSHAPRARTEPPRAPVASSYSFTALIAHHAAASSEDDAAADEARAVVATIDADTLAEGDAAAASESAVIAAPPHPRLLALAPLRGPDFGNAVHAVFERRVIGEPLTHQRGLIARSLHEFGVRSDALARDAAIDVVAERVQATLDDEILPGLRLRDVPATKQRAEMAFHFVLDAVSMDALRAACRRHGAETLLPPELPQAKLRGLMTGKIDLVFEHGGRFHVLDYKSNWLGERVDDYTKQHLDTAMDAHAYRFQALLYSVAVQRYLRQRMGERYDAATHLGEAIYLFVRAVGLAPGAGVWRQRFDPALLDAVDRVFAGALRTEAA